MRNFYVFLILWLSACGSDKPVQPELEPMPLVGSIHHRRTKVVGWKKVYDRTKSLEPIGYVEIKKIPVGKKYIKSSNVLSKRHEILGTISSLGDVSRIIYDEGIKQIVREDLGEHTFYVGVAMLLGYKGKEQFQIEIENFTKEDTYVYQRFVKKSLNAEQLKQFEKEQREKQDQGSDEDEE